jgi:hypothetical protein
MQPQTTHAAAAAKNIASCACCIVVHSVAQHHSSNYNTDGALSLASNQLRQLRDIRRNPPRVVFGEQLDGQNRRPRAAA